MPTQLPEEIIVHIAIILRKQCYFHTLAKLATLSRRYSQIITPVLYERIQLSDCCIYEDNEQKYDRNDIILLANSNERYVNYRKCISTIHKNNLLKDMVRKVQVECIRHDIPVLKFPLLQHVDLFNEKCAIPGSCCCNTSSFLEQNCIFTSLYLSSSLDYLIDVLECQIKYRHGKINSKISHPLKQIYWRWRLNEKENKDDCVQRLSELLHALEVTTLHIRFCTTIETSSPFPTWMILNVPQTTVAELDVKDLNLVSNLDPGKLDMVSSLWVRSPVSSIDLESFIKKTPNLRVLILHGGYKNKTDSLSDQTIISLERLYCVRVEGVLVLDQNKILRIRQEQNLD